MMKTFKFILSIFLVLFSISFIAVRAYAHNPTQLTSYTSLSPHSTIQEIAPFFQRFKTLPEMEQEALLSILRRDRLWNSTLVTVCFGPYEDVKNRLALTHKIITIAKQWTVDTRIKLDFGTSSIRICDDKNSANVRVKISAPQSAPIFDSLPGNQSATYSIKGVEPFSMRLLFPNGDPYYDSEEVIKFYVLHEFGHALGIEHEHQRVDCGFDYKFIAQEFGFKDKTQAEANLQPAFFTKVKAYPVNKAVITPTTVETAQDNNSVMKYNLSTTKFPGGDDPRVYVKGAASPCYRPGWVSSLTNYDLIGIKAAYSMPNVATAELIQRFKEVEPSGLPPSVSKRLFNPELGRSLFSEISESRAFLVQSNATPESKSITATTNTVLKSPQARALLVEILGKRN